MATFEYKVSKLKNGTITYTATILDMHSPEEAQHILAKLRDEARQSSLAPAMNDNLHVHVQEIPKKHLDIKQTKQNIQKLNNDIKRLKKEQLLTAFSSIIFGGIIIIVLSALSSIALGTSPMALATLAALFVCSALFGVLSVEQHKDMSKEIVGLQKNCDNEKARLKKACPNENLSNVISRQQTDVVVSEISKTILNTFGREHHLIASSPAKKNDSLSTVSAKLK